MDDRGRCCFRSRRRRRRRRRRCHRSVTDWKGKARRNFHTGGTSARARRTSPLSRCGWQFSDCVPSHSPSKYNHEFFTRIIAPTTLINSHLVFIYFFIFFFFSPLDFNTSHRKNKKKKSIDFFLLIISRYLRTYEMNSFGGKWKQKKPICEIINFFLSILEIGFVKIVQRT